MSQQQYRKAYDAYQQAVYRDGRNPTFWCSIGVLYYQINQYRDALDAYSRAIRLNPYLSEVWYDLGTLYESCNQIQDSLDAYQRAAELDPGNKHIQQRLAALRTTKSAAPPATREQPATDGVVHEEKTPMTLEPRASHMSNEPARASGGPPSIPLVPDLVDLSTDSERRTLPSTHEMRSNKSEKKEEVKQGKESFFGGKLMNRE
jgi:glucose repression mediator protein